MIKCRIGLRNECGRLLILYFNWFFLDFSLPYFSWSLWVLILLHLCCFFFFLVLLVFGVKWASSSKYICRLWTIPYTKRLNGLNSICPRQKARWSVGGSKSLISKIFFLTGSFIKSFVITPFMNYKSQLKNKNISENNNPKEKNKN